MFGSPNVGPLLIWPGGPSENGGGIYLQATDRLLIEFQKQPGVVGQEWWVFNSALVSIDLMVIDCQFSE